MFKAWQVFLFSMIPLALVFAGVIIGSIHGSDSRLEEFAPIAPRPTPAPLPAGSTVLNLRAQNLRWVPESLSAPANTQITIRMDNQDATVLHSVSIYRSRTPSAANRIFEGELVTGPTVKDYSFRTPGPGNYFFICDVHPDMVGAFSVR